MKLRFFFATLAMVMLLALGSIACGGDDDDDRGPEVTQDGDDATETPTIAGIEPTWATKLQGFLVVVETADDQAREDHPNYASDAADADAYASDMQGPANDLQNQLFDLNPPPEGLEEQFTALQTAIAVWTYALPVGDFPAIEAGLAGVQSACEPIQAFVDDRGEGVDLNCDFSD